MNHGSGGRISSNLISNLFLKYFDNDIIKELTDSAILNINKDLLAFTTDSYVIDPIFFPGGNIGKLAVCGTVNDLAVSGSIPLFLSTSFIIEEGFDLKSLELIVRSMSDTAKQANVKIVTGDTKVVPHGKCDKIFITTAGIGILDEGKKNISFGKKVKAGDKIIINGSIGDHAIAILSQRDIGSLSVNITSDCTPLNIFIQKCLEFCPEISFMRDITRGGLAAISGELSEKINLGIELFEDKIPIKESVLAVCELTGFDPLSLANEGKVLIVVPENCADNLIKNMRNMPEGKEAAIIGTIVEHHPSKVVLHTNTGGKRLIEIPAGIQLPRIC